MAIRAGSFSSWAMALQASQLMALNHVEATVVSHGASVACGDWRASVLLLVKRLGNKVVAGAAISATERAAAWETALALLSLCGKAMVRCNDVCRTAGASACGRAPRWRHALHFLPGAQETHNAALCAARRARRWAVAVAAFAALRREMEPDLATSNAALGVLPWQEALEWDGASLESLARRGTLLGSCSRARQWQHGLHLASRAEAEELYDVLLPWCPTPVATQMVGQTGQQVVAADVLMQRHCEEGRPEEAWELLSNSQRSAVEHLWGVALLGCEEPKVIHAVCTESLEEVRTQHLLPNQLASVFWSVSLLGAENPYLDAKLAEETLRRLREFELDELLTVVSGCWSKSPQIYFAAQQRVAEVLQQLNKESFLLHDLGLQVLGVVFSCHLASCLSGRYLRLVRSALCAAGRALDTLVVEKQPTANAVADFGDRAVLLKEPNWEVYGGHAARQLSETLPPSVLSQDQSHACGFLHRLDVASSGLVVAARSYEAFYDLQETGLGTHESSVGGVL